jgi:hypothetical protein
MLTGLFALSILAAPYAWLDDWKGDLPDHVPAEQRFPTPDGFERIAVEPGSYGAWLRALPIRLDRTHVLAYDGRRLARPSAGLVLMDVGNRDLQQCADSAIRLHAEWLWSSGQADDAKYHFTSGDRTRWRDWRQGERFKVSGSKVRRVRGKARSGSHRSYRRWLDLVFRYAGTRSLRLDSDHSHNIQPGDFYVQPGGPGHAVVVLDVAQHRDGRRVALVGQGFMPAEDFHVLRAGHDRVIDGVWFLLPDKDHRTLNTPSWAPFDAMDARRFRR